ncbi:MAG: MFS transporter [Dehalococcoidia bacterium]
MNVLRRPRSVFYGWWIVAGGMLVQILIGGLMLQAFGAYAAVLRDQFGWSKTTLSAAFAMTRVESGILGPLQGWAVDRFGAGFMVRIGVTLMGLGFLAFSQINSLPMFFGSYFLIAVGSSLAGFMTLTVAVVNWFERKRALALGLMSTGFAVGGLIVPLVVFSMDTAGWRWTAFGSGILVLVAGHVLATFIRHRPEDHGWTVDGIPERVDIEAGPDSADGGGLPRVHTMHRDYTAREALRTPAFWYIALGHASALLVVSAVMVHLVLHVNENLGYSLRAAGFVVALLTGMQIVGQLGGGYLGDRLNKRAIIVACMAGHAVGLLLLAFAVNFLMIFAFAVLHGLAWGGRGPLMQAIRADYFGRTSFGTITGFSSLVVMMGMTAGPIVAGVLADQTGNYEAGFTVLAGLAALGSVFFILARPPRRPGEATAPPVPGRELVAER